MNKSNGIGVAASKAAMPAVVHIKTLLKSATDNSNFRQPMATNPEAIFLQWFRFRCIIPRRIYSNKQSCYRKCFRN
jgi:hypothetical protein